MVQAIIRENSPGNRSKTTCRILFMSCHHTRAHAPVNDVFVNFLPVFRVLFRADLGRDVSQTSASDVHRAPHGNYKPHHTHLYVAYQQAPPSM